MKIKLGPVYLAANIRHFPRVYGKDSERGGGVARGEQRSFENFDVRHSSAAWQLQFR